MIKEVKGRIRPEGTGRKGEKVHEKRSIEVLVAEALGEGAEGFNRLAEQVTGCLVSPMEVKVPSLAGPTPVALVEPPLNASKIPQTGGIATIGTEIGYGGEDNIGTGLPGGVVKLGTDSRNGGGSNIGTRRGKIDVVKAREAKEEEEGKSKKRRRERRKSRKENKCMKTLEGGNRSKGGKEVVEKSKKKEKEEGASGRPLLGKGCAKLQSEPLLGKGSDRDNMNTIPMSEANKGPDIGVEGVGSKGVKGVKEVKGGGAGCQERKHKEERGGTFPECRVVNTHRHSNVQILLTTLDPKKKDAVNCQENFLL